jgi:mRNA-degrading endonuclease toxin of MazEF toxin-antitoxin module
LEKAFIVHVVQVRTIDKTRLLARGIATLQDEVTAEVRRAE